MTWKAIPKPLKNVSNQEFLTIIANNKPRNSTIYKGHTCRISARLLITMGKPMYIEIVEDDDQWGIRPSNGNETARRVTKSGNFSITDVVRRKGLAIGRYTVRREGNVWVAQSP